MPIETPARLPALLLAAAALAGCATPVPPRDAPPMNAMVLPVPAPPVATPVAAPPPAPAPDLQPAAALPQPALGAVDQVLAYADRIRPLAAPELALEIQRLGETSYSPVRAMQLALALGQSGQPANVARAQSLLQRVLAQQDAAAQPLHPLARLVADQLASERRAEEQAERQAQQLREAQRRVEQLTERLEAVRAIERSLPLQRRNEAPARAAPRPGAH